MKRGIKLVRSLWWLHRHGLLGWHNLRAVWRQSEQPFWWEAAVLVSDEEWAELQEIMESM